MLTRTKARLLSCFWHKLSPFLGGGGGHLFLLEDQLNPKLPVSAFHIHLQRRVQPQWSWDDEATISATGSSLPSTLSFHTPLSASNSIWRRKRTAEPVFVLPGRSNFFSFFAIIPTSSQYSQSSKSLQKFNCISKKEKKRKRSG